MNASDAKIPNLDGDWQSIDIFLFSNGQQFSPPRKYHLRCEDLDWWEPTLSQLARSHYGIQHPMIDLYTTDGRKLEGPLELKDGMAYVAVLPPEKFIDTGYEKYLIRATKSWEKRQAKKVSPVDITADDKPVCEHDKLCCICPEKEEMCEHHPCCICPEKEGIDDNEPPTLDTNDLTGLRAPDGNYVDPVLAIAGGGRRTGENSPKKVEQGPRLGEHGARSSVNGTRKPGYGPKSGEIARMGEGGARQSDIARPGENALPVGEYGPIKGEHGPRSGEHGSKLSENGQWADGNGAKMGEHGPRLSDSGAKISEAGPRSGEYGAKPGGYESRPSKDESRLGIHGGRTNEQGGRESEYGGKVDEHGGKRDEHDGRRSGEHSDRQGEHDGKSIESDGRDSGYESRPSAQGGRVDEYGRENGLEIRGDGYGGRVGDRGGRAGEYEGREGDSRSRLGEHGARENGPRDRPGAHGGRAAEYGSQDELENRGGAKGGRADEYSRENGLETRGNEHEGKVTEQGSRGRGRGGRAGEYEGRRTDSGSRVGEYGGRENGHRDKPGAHGGRAAEYGRQDEFENRGGEQGSGVIEHAQRDRGNEYGIENGLEIIGDENEGRVNEQAGRAGEYEGRGGDSGSRVGELRGRENGHRDRPGAHGGRAQEYGSQDELENRGGEQGSGVGNRGSRVGEYGGRERDRGGRLGDHGNIEGDRGGRVDKHGSREGDRGGRVGENRSRDRDRGGRVGEHENKDGDRGGRMSARGSIERDRGGRVSGAGVSGMTGMSYISETQQHVKRTSLSTTKPSTENKKRLSAGQHPTFKKPSPNPVLSVPQRRSDDKKPIRNSKEITPKKIIGKSIAKPNGVPASNVVPKSKVPPKSHRNQTVIRRVSTSLTKIISNNKGLTTDSAPVENIIDGKEKIVVSTNLYRNQESEITSMKLDTGETPLIKDFSDETQTEPITVQHSITSFGVNEEVQTYIEQVTEEVKKKGDGVYITRNVTRTNSKRVNRNISQRDNMVSTDDPTDDNYIAIINKGDVLNLKLNIEVRNGNRTLNTSHQNGRKSHSLTNVTRTDKGSQISFDDGMILQSKSLQSLLNNECFRGTSLEGRPKVLVVQCACCGQKTFNLPRFDSIPSNDNKKYYVLLPHCPHEEDNRCDYDPASRQSYDQKTHSELKSHSSSLPIRKTYSNTSLECITTLRETGLSSSRHHDEMVVATSDSTSQTAEQHSEYVMTKRKVSITEDQNVPCNFPSRSTSQILLTLIQQNVIADNSGSCPKIFIQVADSHAQTEWCNVLLEARRHDDGHYSFHFPPLHVLQYYIT